VEREGINWRNSKNEPMRKGGCPSEEKEISPISSWGVGQGELEERVKVKSSSPEGGALSY